MDAPARSESEQTGAVYKFTIGRPDLKLTQMKVFAVAELETNKFALPLWHMVSDSNSPPVKSASGSERRIATCSGKTCSP